MLRKCFEGILRWFFRLPRIMCRGLRDKDGTLQSFPVWSARKRHSHEGKVLLFLEAASLGYLNPYVRMNGLGHNLNSIQILAHISLFSIEHTMSPPGSLYKQLLL